MKRSLTSMFLIVSAVMASAQTVTVISPTGDGGFETGTTMAANGWTYVGNASTNVWRVGTGAVSAGSRGCFIGTSTTNNTGSNGATTRNHFYRQVTIPASVTNVRLSFKRRQTQGEPTADDLYDKFGVFTSASIPVSGSYPPAGVTTYLNTDDLQASFATFGPYNLNATAGNTFYLIFSYTNADAFAGVGNPAVDEISLTYDCTAASTSTLSAGAPMCLGGSTTITPGMAGGTWSSSNTSIATVSGGVVSAGTTTGTATITYITSNQCVATRVVTVSAKPTVTITPSATSLCATGTLNLTAATVSATGAGSPVTYNWSGPGYSASTSVNTASYVVPSTAASGVYSLSVAFANSGCTSPVAVTSSITVNAQPVLGGATELCAVGVATVTTTVPGGTWASSNTAVATVSGGVVTGVSDGVVNITHTSPASCSAVRSIVVNPMPGVSIAPGTSAALCTGEGQLFTATSPDPQLTLFSQNFNSTIPGWTINSTAGTAASHWQIVSGGGAAGFAGNGSPYLQAASLLSPSPANPATNTTITSPSFSTMGSYSSVKLSFNQVLYSFAPPDIKAAVEYSIDGGSNWFPIGSDLVGSAIPDDGDNGDWNTATPEFNRDLPPAAVGQPNVKIRFVYNAQSLYWLIDNIAVKGTMPASSFAWTGSSGISCAACAATTIAPTSVATHNYNLAVTTTKNCVVNSPVTVTVNALPDPISGTTIICENAGSTLSSAPSGTWSSSDVGVATIGVTTGGLQGVGAGTTGITYTLPTGCVATAVATVLPAPAAITPAIPVVDVCFSYNTTLSNATAGGVWASNNGSIASVSAAGSTATITGGAVGSTTVSYTMPNGCFEVRDVTVNPLPADIDGATAVCVNATTMFTNAVGLGTWSSDDAGIASVNPASGEVTGVAQGNTYITYTLSTGCYKVRPIQVNPLPMATTGDATICQGNTTLLFNGTGSGTWSSSAPAIASVNSSGVVTAGSFTGPVDIYYTITATGCRYEHAMVVNPLPQAIDGPSKVCKDATITLTDADMFGTWTSEDPTIAPVDMFGVVTGASVGNTRITYTLPTGCMTSKNIAVNANPNDISGAAAVCYGASINLLNTTSAGTWSSSDVAVATVSSIGRVTPVAVAGGTTTITYMITASGCYKTHDVVVNPLPAPIDGTTTLCQGDVTTLSNASGAGTWSSSNAAVMSIGATTGDATAVGAGSANITFTLPTGCRTTTGALVNPLPTEILGNTTVCVDGLTTLFSLTTSGTWSTSDAAIATVVDGDVTGIQGGTANISYTLGTGCYTSVEVLVNPLPDFITGNFAICIGSTSDLTSADAGGAWTSSDPFRASVNGTGTVSGNNVGNATITYTLPTGCLRTQGVVVNPLPAFITGIASVCEGAETDLNNVSAGGTWTSETLAVGTVDAATGLVAGIEEGTTNIVYTLPTGCFRSRTVVVNPTPDAISGSLSACLGKTSQLTSDPSNGTWSSSSASVAGINSLGVVTANGVGLANITYTLPAGCRTISAFEVNPLPGAISGSRVICKDGSSTLTNATLNGIWSTTDGFIAGIDAGSGLMTGNSAGVTAVTYTLLTTGCARSAGVTVNPLPEAITGNINVCAGATTALATLSTGGTWSSSDPSVASVSITGEVTGHNAGNADIAYTFSTGCRTSVTVTVNALPDDITGANAVCLGQQTTVLNTTGGGSWTIVDPSIANIDANGVVTGIGVGTTTIAYTIDLTGCYKTRTFTVNALPAAITGNMGICQGTTTVLGNVTPGGTWSSSNPSVAPIVSNTGLATGLNVGFSIIEYTLSTGCSSNTTIVVNPLPETITGTPVMCVAGTTQLETNTMGGTWSTSSAVASVNNAGLVTGVAAGTASIYYTTGQGCRRARIVTVNALPGLISGIATVCPGHTTTLGNTVGGGTWFSDDHSVATISNTGVVSPATTIGGTANITYTLPTGCARSRQITVHPAVDAITGDGAVCKGSDITLATTATGGAWSSSNVAVAIVVGGTITGNGAGVADIAYTLPTGCKATKQIIVNPLPGNISGAASVCDNAIVTLGNTVAGGSWVSSDETIATITSTGAVTGVDAGNVTITYTLPTGCKTTRGMVVNSLPAIKNVTGGGSYCAGGTGVAVGVDGSDVGVLYKLMNGGTIPVTTTTGAGGIITFSDLTGAGTYMVTAVTPEGCMQDMNGTATIVINPLIAPSVTMVSDNGTTVCAGTEVTYTATGVDGGTTPTYTWMVNGTDVGTTASYAYAPAHGDIVAVRFTSSEACAAPLDAATQIVMTVNANLTPAITVAVTPGDRLCAGQTAIYTATIENGGTTPAYLWMVDGAVVPGATNATYAYMPDNNDLVVCRLTSSHTCVTTSTASSAGITMQIAPVFIPEVEVNAAPGTVVPEGTEVTYTAVVSNAGPTPAYQWLVNMKEIAGATNAIYKTSRLKDGDSVTCRVQGSGECGQTSINSVVMEITPVTGVGTTIMANSDIRLMPNPNNGTFTVSGTLSTKTEETISLEVTNMLGQVIYKGSTTAKAGVVETRIDLGNNLANGMYMLNMSVGTERKAFHFVLKQ